jgi:PKD repeat protein
MKHKGALPYCLASLFLTLSLFSAEGYAQIFTPLPYPAHATFADACGWLDINNDGRLDAVLTFFDQPPVACLNFGADSFQFVQGSPLPSGINFAGLCCGDYNNDGLTDVFITNMGSGSVLLLNHDNGVFQSATGIGLDAYGSYVMATWLDYNNDGYIDLFIPGGGTRFAAGPATANLLFRNNGDGTFSRETESLLATQLTSSSCPAVGDFDNDGYLDIFLTEWGHDNWLFYNNGDGTYQKLTGMEVNANNLVSTTACWGDYDNDGFLDLFVGNGNVDVAPRYHNYLFHNNGNGTFTKVQTGVVATDTSNCWGSAWADVNNDGYIDLFAAGHSATGPLFYINNGDGTFRRDTNTGIAPIPSVSVLSGASFGDYDDDGFLDMLIGGRATPPVYHNNGNSNHWIEITCVGTISNRSAIGARVRVKATIGGKSFWQMREITGTQGLRGTDDLRVHFGLGDATTVDSLAIRWPSGTQMVGTGISANQQLAMTEAIPAGYLKPLFTADVQKGKAAVTVHFTDMSIVDSGTPITSWSWDFQNDGTVDSHEQNPAFTFRNDTGGTYDVSLTISNGSTSKTLVKAGLIQLLPKNTANLSLCMKAYCSSVESPAYSANNAIDGDAGSRWSSAFGDAQWILVELDTVYTVGRVVLKWESAYAKQYRIETAVDTTSWQTVYTETKGNGGVDTVVFSPVDVKYVRLVGVQRASRFGYSLYEFEIYRPAVTGVESPKARPSKFGLMQNYPNPFNPKTVIGYELPVMSAVSLKVYDILGREVRTLKDGQESAGTKSLTFDATELPGGVYFYQMRAGSYTATKKLVLLK